MLRILPVFLILLIILFIGVVIYECGIVGLSLISGICIASVVAVVGGAMFAEKVFYSNNSIKVFICESIKGFKNKMCPLIDWVTIESDGRIYSNKKLP